MFTPGMQERRVGYIYEDERERVYAENKWLRSALQRIIDNGERGGYAYGVAFAALNANGPTGSY